jgi:hypothetical protein
VIRSRSSQTPHENIIANTEFSLIAECPFNNFHGQVEVIRSRSSQTPQENIIANTEFSLIAECPFNNFHEQVEVIRSRSSLPTRLLMKILWRGNHTKSFQFDSGN